MNTKIPPPATTSVIPEGYVQWLAEIKARVQDARLLAELRGLMESEFAHVQTTFPLVSEPVKVAALNAYRDVERGLIQ